MPRVIKHPEARRDEIIDEAQAAFLTEGYENVSLNDVIKRCGVSKGAFYYYFESKAALLEALTDRFARAAYDQIRDALDHSPLDPLTRLNTFFVGSTQAKLASGSAVWEFFAALTRPENELVYARISAASEALFKPLMTSIIETGVRESVFETFDPEGVANIILALAASSRPLVAAVLAANDNAKFEEALAKFETRLRLHGVAIDRLLALPDGSVRLIEPGALKALAKMRVKPSTTPTKTVDRALS